MKAPIEMKRSFSIIFLFSLCLFSIVAQDENKMRKNAIITDPFPTIISWSQEEGFLFLEYQRAILPSIGFDCMVSIEAIEVDYGFWIEEHNLGKAQIDFRWMPAGNGLHGFYQQLGMATIMDLESYHMYIPLEIIYGIGYQYITAFGLIIENSISLSYSTSLEGFPWSWERNIAFSFFKVGWSF